MFFEHRTNLIGTMAKTIVRCEIDHASHTILFVVGGSEDARIEITAAVPAAALERLAEASLRAARGEPADYIGVHPDVAGGDRAVQFYAGCRGLLTITELDGLKPRRVHPELQWSAGAAAALEAELGARLPRLPPLPSRFSYEIWSSEDGLPPTRVRMRHGRQLV
jgi:hypothetical protein